MLNLKSYDFYVENKVLFALYFLYKPKIYLKLGQIFILSRK